MDGVAEADVEIAALRTAMQSEGVSFTDLKANSNNADVYATLYHAFDGRVITRVPFYMIDTAEGYSRLRETFSADDVKNASADPSWIGKRVWYTTPQPRPNDGGKYTCPFSAHNSEAEREAMLEKGFRSDCRKEVTFATRDEADRHVEKRHPRRRAAMERLEEREYRNRQDAIMKLLIEREAGK
jgi:hypothetical protein